MFVYITHTHTYIYAYIYTHIYICIHTHMQSSVHAYKHLMNTFILITFKWYFRQIRLKYILKLILSISFNFPMTARKFKITCIAQITVLLNNKYLSNEENHHRYPFHYLILILIACNFGIQVCDMGSIPSEVLSMVNSSQLMYHIYYLSVIHQKVQRWKRWSFCCSSGCLDKTRSIHSTVIQGMIGAPKGWQSDRGF